MTTAAEWKAISDQVTDAMRAYTRPFVTPLSSRRGSHVSLEGSGSYVLRNDHRLLLTCEHVARLSPLEHRFWGSEQDLRLRGSYAVEPHPIDAACNAVPEEMWFGVDHNALTIPYERFDNEHMIHDPEELLFFRGFASENAHFDMVEHQTDVSGYCSQQKQGVTPSPWIFEMPWEPDKTSISSQTSDEARARMKFSDPAGFSGSLVWNTRYMQCQQLGGAWHPGLADVTGLLQRYDPDTKTLLALRVEHLRAFLEK
jgi:hypothetical protein